MSWLQCISLSNNKPCFPPPCCVLALGNFDGVHIAHRSLIRLASDLQNTEYPNAVCGVFCFFPPSSDFLCENPPPHLSTLEQKLSLLREAGAEYAFLGDFPSMRALSPNEFVQTVLVEQCHAVAVACGFNFRFGNQGKGTPDTLKELLAGPVSVLEQVTMGGDCVSSTRIRNLLRNGDVKQAAMLLGRPYAFVSEVIHGKSLGQRMGFPTVNQCFPDKQLIPYQGVYITLCEWDDTRAIGISNVGVRPPVDAVAQVNCETHLLNISENLYGKQVKISFLCFLRPEQKFDSIEALQRQIQMDKQAAESYKI